MESQEPQQNDTKWIFILFGCAGVIGTAYGVFSDAGWSRFFFGSLFAVVGLALIERMLKLTERLLKWRDKRRTKKSLHVALSELVEVMDDASPIVCGARRVYSLPAILKLMGPFFPKCKDERQPNRDKCLLLTEWYRRIVVHLEHLQSDFCRQAFEDLLRDSQVVIRDIARAAQCCRDYIPGIPPGPNKPNNQETLREAWGQFKPRFNELIKDFGKIRKRCEAYTQVHELNIELLTD